MSVNCKCFIEVDGARVECSLMLASLFRVLAEAKGEIVHNDLIACAAFGIEQTYNGDGVDDNQIRIVVGRLRYKINEVSEKRYIFREENGYRMVMNGDGTEVLKRFQER